MSAYQVINADSLSLLKDTENESVDLIVTDPPYCSLEKHRAVGTTTRLTNDWFPVISNDALAESVADMFRILKPDSHCYVLCDQETHYVIREAAIACGFTWKKFLVWDKEVIGMGYSWRSQHEVICYLEKGKRRLNNLGWPDVLSHKRVRGGYPTEKPVSLMEALIANSSDEGDVVMDMFAGSGSTLQAALNLNRYAIGADVSEKACADIKGRLDGFYQSSNIHQPRKQLSLVNF